MSQMYHHTALKRNQMESSAQPVTPDAYAHCESLVRTFDKDRYLAALFAPPEMRPHLHALYAFAGEIARVRAMVREPLPGEVRLQWWRDVLNGEAWGDVSANPVAAALLDTVTRCDLPRERLITFINAHAFDLYEDAMASLADLDAYAERTSGALFTLSAQILGGKAGTEASMAAAAPAGIAWGVTQRLRSFPRDLVYRQMFVPLDVLAQYGVTRNEVEARQNTPGLRAALAELRGHVRAVLARFAAMAPSIPEACAPAFLAATLTPQLLARLDAAANDPFTEVEVPQWRRQWALWRAARRWPLA
jgi:15-cis-phytoene synthase